VVSQKYTHFIQKSVRKLHESRLFMTSGLLRAAQAKSDGGGGEEDFMLRKKQAKKL
jgi:hypothetical protein